MNDINNNPATLPEGYHLDNFRILLKNVQNLYSDLLTQDEQDFIHQFEMLSSQAQSLYVRLVMRKGPYFRIDSLNYSDIENKNDALEELASHSFISWQIPFPMEAILPLCLKKELVALAGNYDTPNKGLSKPELLQTLMQSPHKEDIQTAANDMLPSLKRNYDDHVNNLLLLFFGNARQGLTEFVTTQLGIMKYENYQIDRNSRFFANRDRLNLMSRLSLLQEWYESEGKDAPIDALENHLEALYAILQESLNQDDYVAAKTQRAITRFARQLERLSPESALPAYQRSIAPPSRERQARILEKLGENETALDLINAIEAAPYHPDEPEKILALKNKLKRKLGDKPSKAQPDNFKEQYLSISRGTNNHDKDNRNIEAIVVDHFSKQEKITLHLENQLFMGLFGLLFWDIIFANTHGAFYNPYQLGPRDLWEADFYLKRKPLFDTRIQELRTTPEWKTRILKNRENKFGIANYFVNWHLLDETTLIQLCDQIPANHLATVFVKMLESLGYYRNGFPDLIQFTADGYHLWEVKGPGDSLQNNQVRWLRFFQQNNIPAGVLYVSWEDA